MTGIPLNETVDESWAGPKYLPLMVTAVPTVPDVGESEVMKGGFTVKLPTLDAPTIVVTTTGPVEAPVGTIHLMVLSDHEV